MRAYHVSAVAAAKGKLYCSSILTYTLICIVRYSRIINTEGRHSVYMVTVEGVFKVAVKVMDM